MSGHDLYCVISNSSTHSQSFVILAFPGRTLACGCFYRMCAEFSDTIDAWALERLAAEDIDTRLFRWFIASLSYELLKLRTDNDLFWFSVIDGLLTTLYLSAREHARATFISMIFSLKISGLVKTRTSDSGLSWPIDPRLWYYFLCAYSADWILLSYRSIPAQSRYIPSLFLTLLC